MTMMLISTVVVVILTVLGARACSASSPTSPGSPLNVARNGLAGLCANQQATAAAGGGEPSNTLLSPADEQQLQESNPSGLQNLRQAAGGSLICQTSTTAGP
jgi:hypothetical protein